MATNKSDRKITELDGGKIIVQQADDYTNRRMQMAIHEKDFLTQTGRLAVRLVEQYGVIAALPIGEDSAGRQSQTLLPEDQVVSRAVTIAELLMASLRERGHIVNLPSPYSQDFDEAV